MLADGLVRRGHHVTLFATGDARTSAELRYRYPQALELMGVTEKVAYQPYELAHVAHAFEQAAGFDLVHDHTKISGTLFSRFSPVPCLTTIHNDFTPERRMVYGAFPDHCYVGISHSHASRMPELNFVGTVYNGLDLSGVTFREHKEDYLLFLGRLDAAKGAHTAVQIALALDMPLVLAGRLDKKEVGFFREHIEPHLDGVKRRYVGEVSGQPKWDLYAGARALLFPIQWQEPFGLVMIEAMATGTPVVATRYGSVPEVVVSGKTGMIVPEEKDLDALVQATREAMALSPRDARAHVEAHFSADKMVEDYLALYEKVLAGRRQDQRAAA